jgi:F0F1-type ATP synthase membrane subunit b/b'
MKDFLERIRNVSQNFLDEKIKFKLKQVNDIYNRIREDLVNEVSQLSNSALKNINSGKISDSLDIFEEIVQRLDFDGKYRKGE